MTLFRHLSHAQPERPRPHRFPVAAKTTADAPPQHGAAALNAEAVPLDKGRAGAGAVHDDAGRVPLRCLIVDDNTHFLESARFLLEREGLAVTGVASTRAEALPLAATGQPDVVLVDVMLGTESGFDLARLLIENDHDGRATVILISTHAEADFAELIEASPAAGFIAKSELSASAIRRIHDSQPR